MLASRLYYKHAIQVLRSFLEDLTLPIYFATKPDAYVRWRENDYHGPPLRGPKGVLAILVKSQTIESSLADQVSELYNNLNSFIHGNERRLVNKGQYTRTWIGHAFNIRDYLEWCEYVTAALTLGAHLLKANLDQWDAYMANRRILCPICHNENDFVTERFVLGGEEFTRYDCQSCGDKMTISFTGNLAFARGKGGEIHSYQY